MTRAAQQAKVIRQASKIWEGLQDWDGPNYHTTLAMVKALLGLVFSPEDVQKIIDTADEEEFLAPYIEAGIEQGEIIPLDRSF